MMVNSWCLLGKEKKEWKGKKTQEEVVVFSV
jgi:hypothetical protein